MTFLQKCHQISCISHITIDNDNIIVDKEKKLSIDVALDMPLDSEPKSTPLPDDSVITNHLK